MSSWHDFAAAAPELAARVRERLEATGLALIATLTSDGSPRISPVEPLIALGELWLGMMPASRKAADLRRDPRIALHGATVDKQVTAGDAKLAGRAEQVTDPATVQAYREAFGAQAGEPVPPALALFRVELTSASFLMPAGDRLDVTVWREGGPAATVEVR
ncbi:MAG: pyridoxamine 5-phosphate oxidase-related FMN-binding protein [Mycobacterium sp.]|nr:pyridoxamine 5-phosphate oxidase-related FMN-binding protein [Mycobacterium sp.]